MFVCVYVFGGNKFINGETVNRPIQYRKIEVVTHTTRFNDSKDSKDIFQTNNMVLGV